MAGLGTTNWFNRHGEVIVDGRAADPRFLWADPAAGQPCAIEDLRSAALDGLLRSPSQADVDGVPSFPFAAAGVFGPDSPTETYRLRDGADLHAVVGERCASANVGLAVCLFRGPTRVVEYQSALHIPLAGVASDRPLVPVVRRIAGETWQASGFYSPSPTIQSLIGVEGVDVHIHGHAAAARTGGHVNLIIAATGAEVAVVPLTDLRLWIRGLDVAMQPVAEVVSPPPLVPASPSKETRA